MARCDRHCGWCGRCDDEHHPSAPRLKPGQSPAEALRVSLEQLSREHAA